MAAYIQFKGAEGLETVDEFPTFREAREALKQYRISDPQGCYYTSARACKAWRDSQKGANDK